VASSTSEIGLAEERELAKRVFFWGILVKDIHLELHRLERVYTRFAFTVRGGGYSLHFLELVGWDGEGLVVLTLI